MKRINVFIVLVILFIGLSLVSCGGDKKESGGAGAGSSVSNATSGNKQLNITLLLDLSDRIEPSKYPDSPEHWEKDLTIIDQFVSIFKNEMFVKKNRDMKGKMRVIFSPAPQDAEINDIAKKLDVNTASMKPAEKTDLYKNIENNFTENLKKIYEKTLQTKNYIGSDIWRFFKNDVKDLAVDSDKNYRNILVILTDGYIYHKDTQMKEANRLSYILPNTAKDLGLTSNDWKQKMDKLDFGLITPRKDLDDLEVLILETNPSKTASPYEEDIQKEVISKWLKEMGVKKFNVYKTDLPQTTKKRIESFINEK